MPISGIVVQIDPVQKQEIVASLEGMPQVELEPVPDGEILVAVVDAEDFEQENGVVNAISTLPGVKNVTLSYHNFEDMADA